jgi:Protein of unknown function (DUF2829).
MKKYLGVKIIGAEPMSEYDFVLETKGIEEFEKVRMDRDCRSGYKVVYEDGYVSWSPKNVFEKAYRPIDNLTFGLAIEALKQGKKVARKGWNGKGMYLKLNSSYPVNGHLNPDSPHNVLPETNPDGSPNITQGKGGQMLSFIVMKVAGDSQYWGEGFSDYVPWLASQTDILAEDWVILEDS